MSELRSDLGPQTVSPEAPLDAQQSLVLYGVINAVEWVRGRRTERLTEKIGNLEQELQTPEVIQNTAKRMLIPGRPSHERTPNQKQEDHETLYGYYALSDAADGKRSLRPVTRTERNEAYRAGRRLRNNMRKAVVNRTFELTYSEQGAPIGSETHATLISRERLTARERKGARKAAKIYDKNSQAINKSIEDLRRTASGEDIYGEQLRLETERTQARIDRKQSKLIKTRNGEGRIGNTLIAAAGKRQELINRFLSRRQIILAEIETRKNHPSKEENPGGE